MKKIATVIVSGLIIALCGCEKGQKDFDSINSLKVELNALANSQIEVMEEPDPCYSDNQYDVWGESLFIGMTKSSQTKSEFGTPMINNNKEFGERLKFEIPKEYLSLDTNKVNLKTVEAIADEFLSLYIKKNIFESMLLAKRMEALVIKSDILNEIDKAYILKFVSLVRYSTYFNYTISNSRKGSFETCWKRELGKIEDMGFFSRAACVIDWPMCLGGVLADCLWEELTN